ncbi:MAG: polysulfide reductase NrfD [Candidatus Kapabacteria bacterium]|jgi:Ni/Fe-hydrogenase subunit HybB-like protein|nr:polysulfide reductase NrfD [Candidatus Kapabacteria bacterium]
MLDKIFTGGKKYWAWMIFLSSIIGAGTLAYLHQYEVGLGVTGMGRDVTWAFYISQLTFFVGVAASAVMVVLPYYLHDYKKFGKITILGEFLAIGAVIMCMTFVFVDMGQPLRVVNMFLHPQLTSPMFWDSVSLMGYLVLNIVISRVVLNAERNGVKPPKWIKPVIYTSIPWAVSIHTVTAFLYCGLAARPFWMSAIMAPRFLATAFAAGPALLIIICFVLRKVSKFDVGKDAIQKLAVIAAYAMFANIFFLALEFFTAYYSGMHHHTQHFQLLYVGLEGNSSLVPWMWTSTVLAAISLYILINPNTRKNEKILGFGAIAVFLSIWMDKGMGLIIAGLVPNPLGYVVDYTPTLIELTISAGIFALGALIISALYKSVLTIRRQV